MLTVECNRLVRRAADIAHARVGQAEVGGKRRGGSWGYGKDLTVPTWIVDGDHDEAIKREDTDHMAALIPGAGELILPEVSHFAFLQDPTLFNAALLHFLGDR